MRVVIVVSHPIQHFCPQYRSLAALDGVELTVIFDTMKGVEGYHDEGFGRAVRWGNDLVSDFEWIVLESGTQTLAEVLREAEPDWLIVYGYTSSISRKAWLWATFRSVRLAYISDSELRHEQSPVKLALKRQVLRKLFRRVDLFLSVGDANSEFYRQMGACDADITLMHFPIDVRQFGNPERTPSIEETARLRSDLKISPEAVVITTVGKFISRKRQSDLIEACRRFTKDQAHLVLIGSGPDLERLSALARSAENVTIVGFVAPNDLAPYYEMTDVYAHVSSYDPHPLAVSEALASGCALVVSSATGSWGNNDDVRVFTNGLVVPVADTDSLRNALALLIGDSQMRTGFARASREISREHQTLAHGGFVAELSHLTARSKPRSPLTRSLRR